MFAAPIPGSRAGSSRAEKVQTGWTDRISSFAPSGAISTPSPWYRVGRPGGRGRSEANCSASGCKSRQRKSPCGAVAISGSLQGNLKPGSPDVKALDGPVGTEPSPSGQLRGRTTRRAAAKANGLTAEKGCRTKLIQAEDRSAKRFFPLVDGQCRCGSNGETHASDYRRKLKAAILESRAVKARKVWNPGRMIHECQRPIL